MSKGYSDGRNEAVAVPTYPAPDWRPRGGCSTLGFAVRVVEKITGTAEGLGQYVADAKTNLLTVGGLSRPLRSFDATAATGLSVFGLIVALAGASATLFLHCILFPHVRQGQSAGRLRSP